MFNKAPSGMAHEEHFVTVCCVLKHFLYLIFVGDSNGWLVEQLLPLSGFHLEWMWKCPGKLVKIRMLKLFLLSLRIWESHWKSDFQTYWSLESLKVWGLAPILIYDVCMFCFWKIWMWNNNCEHHYITSSSNVSNMQQELRDYCELISG